MKLWVCASFVLHSISVYGKIYLTIFKGVTSNENLAKNYISAAEIMLSYGNPAKAKKLLGKAYIAAQSTDNIDLKRYVSDKLALV